VGGSLLNELSLFSGVGGGILGTRTISQVVCAVERDAYCREILLRRQEEGHLEPFPIWDDVRTFDGTEWAGGVVDLVSAGFPCQPFSVAGKRFGAEDPNNLWPDTARIIREIEPNWVLLENTPGLLGSHGYFGQVLGDLAASGYVCRWDHVPACAIGANHKRDRVWVIAYADGEPVWDKPGRWHGASGEGSTIAVNDGWWSTKPGIRRVDDDVPFAVDRLSALGQAQVPAVVRRVWELMTSDGHARYWTGEGWGS